MSDEPVCTCPRINIGMTTTEHRNLSPDCPVHGAEHDRQADILFGRVGRADGPVTDPTDEQIEQWAAEAEAGYDTSLMDPNSAIAVGQRRRTPYQKVFTVMRLDVLNRQALIRFDDKTTDWWPFDWVRNDSVVES